MLASRLQDFRRARPVSAVLSLARWLAANLPWSESLRASPYWFAGVLTLHVVFAAVVAGLVVMMDLRLAGAGHLRTSAAAMHGRLFPWFAGAFALAVLTGTAMVWTDPLRYYGKTFFWWKMGLVGVAGLNAGCLQLASRREGFRWEGGAARAAGIASLLLWAGVVALGRLTAYEWFTAEY